MKKLFKKKINIFKLLKKFFRKIINNFRLSHLLLKRETKKLVFLCIAFLITCMTTIIVSSMSLHLGNLLSIDDTVENKVVTVMSNEELNPEILDYATTFTDNTIVKSASVTSGPDINVDPFFKLFFTDNFNPDVYLRDVQVIDTNYDTFDKYDERNEGKTPLSNSGEFEIAIRSAYGTYLGPYEFETTVNNQTTKGTVNIVANDTDFTYISDSFFKYFQEIYDYIELHEFVYTFSFASVKDAVNFYNKIIQIDLSFQETLRYPGATLSNIIATMQQAGFIICVLALVAFITLIVCFLNILIILFIDKQKNIGLLKAQGLTNFRITNALLSRIIFIVAICAALGSVAAYFLMPVVSEAIYSMFMGQYLSNFKIVINIWYVIFIPIAAFLMVVIPCIVYVATKFKTPAINLIRG